MQTKDIFVNDIQDILIKKYISVYLKEFVGYRISYNDIKFKKLSFNDNNMYIVVLKDDIRRIDVKSGGSGVLRQRQWSVFVFNFIELCRYVKYFGRNKNKKEIAEPYSNKKFDEFEYDKEQLTCCKKNPENIFSSPRIKFLLHNYIFNKLFSEYRYLFLNTYVYSVIGVVDIENNRYEDKSISTFYYNTNHVFRQITAKNIINQKVDINKTSYLVDKIDEEFSIIEKNYNDMADLVNAYVGRLPLNAVTSMNYKSIEEDILKNVNYIITEGMARTGKTVIAMRILGKFQAARAIIMNPYFYKTLKEIFRVEKIAFPEDRIACHTEFNKVEHIINTAKILVVDEAQRLSASQISDIVSNQNHITVFLGDNLQKMNSQYDRGMTDIENIIKSAGYDYTKYYFNHAIGISDNVLYSIKYILFQDIPLGGQNINKYEINIYDDLIKFKNKYQSDSTFRKHMATVYIGCHDYNETIEGFARWNLKSLKTYPYFLDKDVKESVMLTTYEMISRELDSIYIYLPKSIYGDDTGLHYMVGEQDEYLRNQIYVLMTRAKGCINLYCENRSAYEYIIKRYGTIIDNRNKKERLTSEEKQKSRIIESQIVERGITRLIHFTDADNLKSIYENGLMSVKQMKMLGIEYKYNDNDRLDGVYDGISLSVQNPNHYLLKRFKQRYPDREYVFLVLDPALLYEIADESGEKLADRLYCNYNAASRKTRHSADDLQIMFEDAFNGGSWINTRIYKDDSEPTTNQAEILFRHTIHPKYILEVVEDING